MEYITRGVCGQEGCRERRYYLDNGRWFCRRGHLQEGVQVEEDPEDFGTQGKTHRVKKVATEKSKKTYRGQQAYTLFLQIYQLILWKQCHALVRDQGFPEQFEVVVRDLWALRLQDFSLKLAESADDDDQDERELFSSQPTEKDESHRMGFKVAGKYLQWPRLVDSIGLCYLGALLMRLPICVSDFHRMVIQQAVPYLRVLTAVPLEMRDKLPPEFSALLEIDKLPVPDQFQKRILELAMFYQSRFEITFPPLNAPFILYRHIKRMAIPVEVYSTVQKLHDLVGFPYRYLNQIKGQKWRICLPEAQVMALIVIGTKLLFPLDDVKRYPATNKEPAVQIMNWDAWAQAQRHFDQHERSGDKIGRSNVIHLTDKDVLNMTPRQFDEYMDWYAGSWLDTPRVVNQVADMFPTTRTQGITQPDPDIASSAPSIQPNHALGSALHTVMQDLKPRRVVPDEDQHVPRPGSFYRRYRTEAALTWPAKAFYELAAQVAGISLKTLVRVVASTESKIALSLQDQRRAEYFGVDMDVDSADAMDELDEEMSDLDMNDEV